MFSEAYYFIRPGKLLLEPVTALSKNVSSWKCDEVIPIARLLAGRTLIDGRGDNFEGACAFTSISADLITYISKNPEIRSEVGLVYVVADISGQQHTFELNNYPPAGSPLPALVPLMMSNHIWVFNGADAMGNASHLIGWLQCKVPGLRVFLFHTTHAAVYF